MPWMPPPASWTRRVQSRRGLPRSLVRRHDATTPTRSNPLEAAPVPSALDPSAKDVADAAAFAKAIVASLAHGSAATAAIAVLSAR